MIAAFQRVMNAVPALLLFGFVVLVLLISHQNALGNCYRINHAIEESNSRVPALGIQKEVLRNNLLKSARDARLAEYRRSHHESDLQAAIEYERGIVQVDEKVRFHLLPPINCDKAIHFIP